MTPDELKSIPKGEFVVMKTGSHPIKTRLRLFLDWRITFGEPYCKGSGKFCGKIGHRCSSPPEWIKPLQGIFYSPAFAVPSTPPAMNIASPFLTLGVKQPVFAYSFILIHPHSTRKRRGSQGYHAYILLLRLGLDCADQVQNLRWCSDLHGAVCF